MKTKTKQQQQQKQTKQTTAECCFQVNYDTAQKQGL